MLPPLKLVYFNVTAKVEGKDSPVYAIKVYKGSEVIAPLILNLETGRS
jgi:hypothetical protein